MERQELYIILFLFYLFIYMHNDKTRILFNNTKTNNCAGEEKKPKGLI